MVCIFQAMFLMQIDWNGLFPDEEQDQVFCSPQVEPSTGARFPVSYRLPYLQLMTVDTMELILYLVYNLVS